MYSTAPANWTVVKKSVLFILFFDVRGSSTVNSYRWTGRLQEDPSAYASFSGREETRVATGHIVAALKQQCNCPQTQTIRQFLAERNLIVLEHLDLVRVMFPSTHSQKDDQVDQF